MTLNHTYQAKTKFKLRPAWRLKDPVVERDADLFWRKEGILPPTADLGERLQELCLAAYEGDKLIALTTARIRYIDFLCVKLAMLRVAVAKEYRKDRIGAILFAEARVLLEQWSAANPAEDVLGVGTVAQVFGFAPDTRLQAFKTASRVGFVGWTANGEQMRVGWFEHATIPLRRPTAPIGQQDGFTQQ
jgi:hypothetical protein